MIDITSMISSQNIIIIYHYTFRLMIFHARYFCITCRSVEMDTELYLVHLNDFLNNILDYYTLCYMRNNVFSYMSE